MPFLTIPIATAIAGVAGAGAAIYGASKNSGAAKAASAAESASSQQAIDYQKSQDAIQRDLDADQRNYQRQQDSLSQQRSDEQRDYSRTQYANYLDRLSPYAASGASALPGLQQSIAQGGGIRPGGSMVTLRAPNGQTKQVPQAELSHWLSMGAQQVGG